MVAEPAKNRSARVWSMNMGGRESFLESIKLVENVQKFLDSRAGVGLREGIPVFLICLFAGQGKLIGGSMPFATALMAGSMMQGKSVAWAAAGCGIGALIGGSVPMLLACALLFILYTALRMTALAPNDLTCVISAGIVSYLIPILFAQTMYDHLMAISGAVVSMVLARMYASALRIRLYDRQLLSPEEIISFSLLVVGVLTGFRALTIFGVSPVLSVLMLLCIGAGYLCGAGMGAAVGALTGLMMGVTLPEQPYLIGGMVLLGLMAGVFSNLGKWGTAAVVPVALVLAGAMDARFLTWMRAVEAALALLGFVLIKKETWAYLRVFVSREEKVREQAVLTQGGVRGEVHGKLQEYATLYGRMAQTLSGYGGGGQYQAVSTALHAVANDLSVSVRDQPQLSRDIAQELDRAHIRVEGVQAQRVGEKCRVCVQLMCKRRDGLCDKHMVKLISKATGKPLTIRQTGICPQQGACALMLEEACAFEASVGFASMPPSGNGVCGDTLTTVQLPEGQYMMALADGMGHGQRAQEESNAAVDLLEDFLLARFEPEAALCGVNDLLLKRDDDECFSTMDLSLIDLTKGTLRAMKIGAVSSYIRRGRRIISITGDALPMGIMEKVRPSVTQLQMQDGDVLIMLSDGVLDAVGGNEAWLNNEILGMDVRNPEQSARTIIQRARAVGRHQDDMTIGILRLVSKRHL